jgi:hypothetical protein
LKVIKQLEESALPEGKIAVVVLSLMLLELNSAPI